MKNLASDPGSKAVMADLKARLLRLQAELGDTGQFADKIPADTVDRRPKQMDQKHSDSQL